MSGVIPTTWVGFFNSPSIQLLCSSSASMRPLPLKLLLLPTSTVSWYYLYYFYFYFILNHLLPPPPGCPPPSSPQRTICSRLEYHSVKAVAKSLLRDSGKSVENRDAKSGGLGEPVCANFSPPCMFGCFLLISAYRRCFANVRCFYYIILGF